MSSAIEEEEQMGMSFRLDRDLPIPVILCDQCNCEIRNTSADVLFAATDGCGHYQVGTYVAAAFVHKRCAGDYRSAHRTWQRYEMTTWLVMLKMSYPVSERIESDLTARISGTATT
jgi:hypothetical protein